VASLNHPNICPPFDIGPGYMAVCLATVALSQSDARTAI